MAVFNQERHVELVSGASEAFVITNFMVSASIPAELPHVSVFVMSVADVDDPKQDVLARVARVSDLSLLPIGRDAGIASPGVDGIEYLSASATVVYDTLETANDAALVFQDRVNALVEAWILFRNEFSAPDPSPASYVFPRGNATQKATLIAAYKAAKQDRYQKQLAKTAADTTLTKAQADYTYKQGLLSTLSTLSTKAATNVTEMSSVSAALGSLIVSGNAFLSVSSLSSSSADRITFAAALTNATTQQTVSIGYVSDASSMQSTIAAYLAARTTDASTASTALVAAQSDQLTKAQQLLTAQTAETAALTALLVVCPDFDKHSIPFVDDSEP